MRQRGWLLLIILLWCLTSGVTTGVASSSGTVKPFKVAQVFRYKFNPAPPPPTTSDDAGRQRATPQSVNRTDQQPIYNPPPPVKQEELPPSFFDRLIGRKRKISKLEAELINIRDALAGYAVMNNGDLPTRTDIYDWRTLREVVNANGKRLMSATEEEAGFRFVRYRTLGSDSYRLLLELHQSQRGVKRIVVGPNGVEKAG